MKLRFTACKQLDRESGDTMFSDLEEAFEDAGVIGTLIQQCYFPPLLPSEQQVDATTTTVTTRTIEAQLQQLQTQNTVGPTALTGQNAANPLQGTTQANQPTHQPTIPPYQPPL